MLFKRKQLCVALIFISAFLFLFQTSTMAGEEKTPEYNPQKTFAISKLKKEFKLLRGALDEAHGGFYYYHTKKEMDRIFDTAYKTIKQPATELQFFKSLMPLIAAIKDGHSRIRLSKTALAYWDKQAVLFPFKIHFLKGRAYLFRNFSDNTEIPMGGELLAINGHTIPEILKQLLPRTPSDAGINSAKFQRLGSTGNFGTSFLAVYGKTTEFSIRYIKPGQDKARTIRVKGIKPEELMTIFARRYAKVAKEISSNVPISLNYKEGIPVLTIKTFGGRPYTQANINYKKFLDDSFKELAAKRISHLIIDLRDNGGGRDDFGKILAAHLLDKPFQYYDSLETRVNAITFSQYTDASPGDAAIMKQRLKANDHGSYDAIGHPNLGIQQPLKPTFNGKVYILINGRSFSATGEATSIIHFHKKATFIGEECGSGYYGNTSGMGVTLTLPLTKIRVSIPLVRYVMAVSNYPKNNGIIPEYKIPTTIDDLMNQKDPQMEFALKLIKKGASAR